MLKKRAIWGLGITLLLVFALLFGLQYTYYNRIISLRKEQTRQLAKDALSEVAHDIELQDLIRYLDSKIDASMRVDREGNTISSYYELTSERAMQTMSRMRYGVGGDADSSSMDSIGVSPKLLDAYLLRRADLDEYVLRHLYEGLATDSIPQLISSRFLKDQLRLRLEQNGVSEAYSFALCDARGARLYEFVSPGMLRKARHYEDVVIERLFVDSNSPYKLTPFLRLTLDFSAKKSEMLSFALPGIVSTVFVFILGIFVIVMLIRQLSFHSMKTSFINNMTHELKTPVSSIKLATTRLKDKDITENPDKRWRFLNMIEQESNRLQLLIEKVLQFSVLDGRTKFIELTTLDLNEIILPVAEIYTAHAQAAGGDLALDLDAYNTWVRVSKTHMTNVIFNLLDNAVKYRSTDRPLYIRIATENIDGWIRIIVEDNGIGIPKDSLRRIFERYYRVPTGHRHDVKGFGLGLAYVASVIKTFEGRIVAENREGGGTRMVIKLPISKDSIQ